MIYPPMECVQPPNTPLQLFLKLPKEASMLQLVKGLLIQNELKWPIAEVAKRSGVHRQTLYDIAAGVQKDSKESTLTAVAAVYGYRLELLNPEEIRLIEEYRRLK